MSFYCNMELTMKVSTPRSSNSGRFRHDKGRTSGRHRIALHLESLETRALLTGTFTALTNVAPSSTGTPMLETNGTVLVQGGGVSNVWYQLTPDSSGSYANGTWSQVASSNLNRLYFGSNVLPNGNIFVQGGEYSGPYGVENDVNSGEIFNPVTNTWNTIATFPEPNYGDDPSEVLPNGNVLAGYLSGPQTFIYNPTTNSWSPGGTKLRNDQSDEECYVKLPDGSILSYDIFASITNGVGSAQRYVPSTNTWVDAGTVPVPLSSPSVGYELGAGFLLPDGRVFYLGGNSNTAFYTESTNTWTAGPVIPDGLGCDDAPGAELPNGDILFTADTPLFNAPSKIFEFNPTTNTYTDLSSELPTSYLNTSSYVDRMLVLPSGQVLFSNTSSQLYVFTPGQAAVAAAVPTITGITQNSDGSFLLSGTGLNGINEGAAYGDDVEMSSNYPIVQLTGGGKVYFARTYNWSSTGVATGSTPESTDFTLPIGLPVNTYQVAVIANGVASSTVTLNVPTTLTDPAPTVATAASATPNPDGGVTASLSVLGADSVGESSLSYSWAATSIPSGAVPPSFSVNGTNAAKNDTVTFTKAGSYTFTVTITNLAGLTNTSSASIVVNQTLTAVSVTYSGQTKPASPKNVTAGGTQQFNASALDQFGNALTTQPSFTWAVTAGGGSVSATGLYTAPASGTMATVTATTSSISGSAAAWVLTSPFLSRDIGSPVAPGASADNGQGTYTIQAAGSGFYNGTSDSFSYAYRTVAGNNITIIARIATQPNTDIYAEAGVMIRSSTSAGSVMAFMGLNAGFGPLYVYRTTTNASSTYGFAGGGPNAPEYVKLVRNGTSFTGYVSPDGVIWTQKFTTTMTMGTTVDVGLADSNYQDGAYNTSTFDHVLVDTPPTVATAAAASPNSDGGLTTNLSVLGAALAGESTLTYTWAATTVPPGAASPTFSINGTNAAKNDIATFYQAGSYVFTVTITSGSGYTVTSAASVTVNQTLTSITLSPTSATIQQGGTQQFTATAFDQFDQSLTTQPSFTYAVVAGGVGGTISLTGLYTAPTSSFGTDQVQVTSGSVSTTANVTVTQAPSTINAVSVNWGTAGSIALQTAADGLRLLPAGRNTDLPWLGINQIVITLSKAETLSPSDVSVTGITIANYGPVTISGSGTTYTITLAQPINAADRVTVTIANAGITSYTRRLDVLPGDVNDDGVVNAQDAVLVRNEYLGLAMPLIFGDINGDGTVDLNDYNAVRKLIGTMLPPLA
jgi:hypothetical protein